MNSFTTAGEAVIENVVSKSRFIAYSFPIEDETAALSKIAFLKKSYPGADHVCYAFIADREGAVCRSCDDGEPQGSAGQPILAALKGAAVRQTLAAVVRYFGGVKLGKGNLTRTYGAAAAAVLAAAPKYEHIFSEVFEVELAFNAAKAFEALLKNGRFSILQKEFIVNVRYKLALPAGSACAAMVAATSAGKGKAVKLSEGYYIY